MEGAGQQKEVLKYNMLANSLFVLLSVMAAQAKSVPVLALNRLPTAPSVAQMNVPFKKDMESFGVEITAKAGAVIDVRSGELLYAKNATTPYPIASLTKLLTVMTFLDLHSNLEEEIMIDQQDVTEDSKIVFGSGERFLKGELLRAVLVGSINTGANTLAGSLGNREEFVRRMNEKARAIGMRHATFVEPTGLDPRNQASAKDVGFALRSALQYPEIREATELEEYTVKGRATGRTYSVKSTNLLLGSFLNKGSYRIIAGKTGSLPEAGFCLAQATKNQKGNEVIAVVLGSENHFSRFQDIKALTAWSYKTFEWR